MNADMRDRDPDFDTMLPHALTEAAAAVHPETGGAPPEVWRHIDRRRHRASRSRVLWQVTAAAAVVALAVGGATVVRGQEAVMDMQPGAVSGPDASAAATPASGSATGSTEQVPESTVPTTAPTVPPAVAPVPPVRPEATSTTAAPRVVPPTTSTAPARPGGIRSIDLTTLSIPTSMCATGERTDVLPAVATIGSAITAQAPQPVAPGNPPAFIRQPMGLAYGTAVYGDLTGDGVDDAVVIVKCTFGAPLPTQFWSRAVVVDGAAATATAGPVLAASGAPIEEDDVPSADGSGANETRGHKVLYESLVDLHIDNGYVVTSWVQTANPVIPRVNQWSRQVENRFHIHDGSFVATGSPRVQPWVKDPYGSTEPFGPTAW
jgi:hypothetical protein